MRILSHPGVALALAVSTLLPLAAGTGAAAPFDGRPKLLLHVGLSTVKNPCVHVAGQITDCTQATTTGDLDQPLVGPFYYVYLLAAKGSLPTVGAFRCGIQYQDGNAADQSDQVGVDIFGWSLCAHLELLVGGPTWPAPGSANLVIFEDGGVCPSTEVVPAGYFYTAAYSADNLRIVLTQPAQGNTYMTRCGAVETELLEGDLGYASFSAGQTTAGCNSCVEECEPPIAVASTSWSRIKSMPGLR